MNRKSLDLNYLATGSFFNRRLLPDLNYKAYTDSRFNAWSSDNKEQRSAQARNYRKKDRSQCRCKSVFRESLPRRSSGDSTSPACPEVVLPAVLCLRPLARRLEMNLSRWREFSRHCDEPLLSASCTQEGST